MAGVCVYVYCLDLDYYGLYFYGVSLAGWIVVFLFERDVAEGGLFVAVWLNA